MTSEVKNLTKGYSVLSGPSEFYPYIPRKKRLEISFALVQKSVGIH